MFRKSFNGLLIGMFKKINNFNKSCCIIFYTILILVVGSSSSHLLVSDSIVVNKFLHVSHQFKKWVSDLNGISDDINLNFSGDDLVILGYGFSNLAIDSNEYDTIYSDEDDDIDAFVIGDLLNYPNPFQYREGTEIIYKLSKNMDIDFHIYDMRAVRIFQKKFSSGGYGGMKGRNKFVVNRETLNGYLLSVGVYFYIVMHEGEVLAKGKMAVKP